MTDPKSIVQDPQEIDKFRFICDVIQKQMESQFDSVDALDKKASLIAGFLSVLLAVSGSIEPDMFGINVLTLGFLLIFVAIFLSVEALWVRTYQHPPNPRAFLYEQAKEGYLSTVNQHSSNMVKAYEENKKMLNRKACYIKASWIVLLFGLILVLLGFVVRKETKMSNEFQHQEQENNQPNAPDGASAKPDTKPVSIPDPKPSQAEYIELGVEPSGNRPPQPRAPQHERVEKDASPNKNLGIPNPKASQEEEFYGGPHLEEEGPKGEDG